MACTGVPSMTVLVMSSIPAGRTSMTELLTVITFSKQYFRGTRNCTRRYGMKSIIWNMRHGLWMKRLRQHQQRNTVQLAESHSVQPVIVNATASHAERLTNAGTTMPGEGNPTRKTRRNCNGFGPRKALRIKHWRIPKSRPLSLVKGSANQPIQKRYTK